MMKTDPFPYQTLLLIRNEDEENIDVEISTEKENGEEHQIMSDNSWSVYLYYLIIFSLVGLRLHDTFVYEIYVDKTYLGQLEQKHFEAVKGENTVYNIKKNYCGYGKKCRIVEPFRLMYPEYLVSDKYKISSCLIPKDMSTLLTSIFCYLTDKDAFLATYTSLFDVGSERNCSDSFRYHSLEQVRNVFRGEEFHNFVLVRDPLERFLSAFMMLCTSSACHSCPNSSCSECSPKLCFGCEDDMLCVAQRLYQTTQKWSETEDTKIMETNLWHFSPQNCRLGSSHSLGNLGLYGHSTVTELDDINGAINSHLEMNDLNSYNFVPYSPLNETDVVSRIQRIFEKGGVPKATINEIREEMSSGTTYHQTSKLNIRDKYAEILHNSKEIQRILVKVYYYDYVFFGYPFPKLE